MRQGPPSDAKDSESKVGPDSLTVPQGVMQARTSVIARTVAVAEAADVADHGPHGGGAREGEACGVPGRRLRPLGNGKGAPSVSVHGEWRMEDNVSYLIPLSCMVNLLLSHGEQQAQLIINYP